MCDAPQCPLPFSPILCYNDDVLMGHVMQEIRNPLTNSIALGILPFSAPVSDKRGPLCTIPYRQTPQMHKS
jgi:hypothetical protein